MSKPVEFKSAKIRRVAAAAGAVVLIAGLSACGANSSSDQPSEQTTTPSAPTTSALPTEPEVPAGKVSVNFDVENCDNCTITALPTGGKEVAIPLSGGKGSSLLNQNQVPKTFFSIDGPRLQGAMAVSVLITQLAGKQAGTPVSNDEVKNAKKANICLAPISGQHLNIKAKVVPVSTSGGTMARFWADPTLDGAPGNSQIDLYDGVAGVQNDGLC